MQKKQGFSGGENLWQKFFIRKKYMVLKEIAKMSLGSITGILKIKKLP